MTSDIGKKQPIPPVAHIEGQFSESTSATKIEPKEIKLGDAPKVTFEATTLPESTTTKLFG